MHFKVVGAVGSQVLKLGLQSERNTCVKSTIEHCHSNWSFQSCTKV